MWTRKILNTDTFHPMSMRGQVKQTVTYWCDLCLISGLINWLLSVYLMSECMNEIAISFCKLSGKVEQPIRVNFRSSHQRRASFLKKVRGCKPATSLKKRLYHNCFPVNFERFLRTPFYGAHPRDCFCKFISINKLVIH